MDTDTEFKYIQPDPKRPGQWGFYHANGQFWGGYFTEDEAIQEFEAEKRYQVQSYAANVRSGRDINGNQLF